MFPCRSGEAGRVPGGGTTEEGGRVGVAGGSRAGVGSWAGSLGTQRGGMRVRRSRAAAHLDRARRLEPDVAQLQRDRLDGQVDPRAQLRRRAPCGGPQWLSRVSCSSGVGVLCLQGSSLAACFRTFNIGSVPLLGLLRHQVRPPRLPSPRAAAAAPRSARCVRARAGHCARNNVYVSSGACLRGKGVWGHSRRARRSGAPVPLGAEEAQAQVGDSYLDVERLDVETWSKGGLRGASAAGYRRP